MRACGVVPVLTIDDAARAVALARALVGGGLRVLEVTLRTPAALDAIAKIAAAVPEAIVGAGTVMTDAQFDAALAAGSRFIVSPGTSDTMIRRAATLPVPWMPAAATPSEVIRLREHGFTVLKFFPAAQYGGVGFLKAVAPLFPDTMFCPTGGVSPDNVAEYLAQPNVLCVGGSWVTPKQAVREGRWGEVTRLAREAATTRA